MGQNNMANFTKKAIQASFLKLLNDRPLSQITVKDIVADCGVNRNTFYYYFEDIPKLCEEIFTEDFETIIRTYPTVEKIDDCLGAVVESILSKSGQFCISTIRQTESYANSIFGTSATMSSTSTSPLS